MNPKQKSALTKIFAVSGVVLLGGPILFMLITAAAVGIESGLFRFDFLMLAELFPVVALGLVMLILASLLSKTLAKWFCWGAGAALAALAGGQILARTSGLASGVAPRSRFAFGVVIASIVVYDVIIVALFVLGIVLVRRLFSKKDEAQSDLAVEEDGR